MTLPQAPKPTPTDHVLHTFSIVIRSQRRVPGTVVGVEFLTKDLREFIRQEDSEATLIITHESHTQCYCEGCIMAVHYDPRLNSCAGHGMAKLFPNNPSVT